MEPVLLELEDSTKQSDFQERKVTNSSKTYSTSLMQKSLKKNDFKEITLKIGKVLFFSATELCPTEAI